MTGIGPIFERLGLQQYLESFLDEGFDTWETVLDITESDLDALNVKLGHRRKLQREIAHARGVSVEQFTSPAIFPTNLEGSHHAEPDNKSLDGHNDGKSVAPTGPKRKYRRHPKVREELRPHKLSFTDIAKTVGEKWQLLSPEEREPYESQAATSKEFYNAEMTRYKRTANYRNYAVYLAEFKARNHGAHTGAKIVEGKRPRLDHEVSSGSSESYSSRTATVGYEHTRKDSLGALGHSPSNSSLNSPTSSLPRALVSHSSVDSFQSSHPGTPLPSHHRPPIISQGASQGPRSMEPSRSQPLPRILSLENRDPAMSQVSLAPLLTDPHSTQRQNPRRSVGTASSFLRHDTSKSSVSSILSSTSGGSPGITPITPHEETRPPRALPPPPLSGPHQYPEAMRSSFAPLAPKSSPGYGNLTPTQSPDYSQTMDRLSIGEIAGNPENHYKRPQPPSRDHVGEEGPVQNLDRYAYSSRHSSPYVRQGETRHSSQDVTVPERLDSLSVLALAGSMVKRDHKDGNDST